MSKEDEDELIESMLKSDIQQNAMRRQREAMLNSIVNPSMITASQLGAGYGNAAQNSMGQYNSAMQNSANQFGTIQSATIQSGVLKTGPMNTIRKTGVDMDFRVAQAANGFIVTIKSGYGEEGQAHIATTLEDISTIIVSELASRMLDKVK